MFFKCCTVILTTRLQRSQTTVWKSCLHALKKQLEAGERQHAFRANPEIFGYPAESCHYRYGTSPLSDCVLHCNDFHLFSCSSLVFCLFTFPFSNFFSLTFQQKDSLKQRELFTINLMLLILSIVDPALIFNSSSRNSTASKIFCYREHFTREQTKILDHFRFNQIKLFYPQLAFCTSFSPSKHNKIIQNSQKIQRHQPQMENSVELLCLNV